jgi:hypothetical protein
LKEHHETNLWTWEEGQSDEEELENKEEDEKDMVVVVGVILC